jgi:predicted PurR-regulated permease PerM
MENLSGYQPFKQLQDNQPFTFDRFVRLLLSIATIVGMIILIRSISNVLVPFFIALLLAYLTDPFVVFIQTGG